MDTYEMRIEHYGYRMGTVLQELHYEAEDGAFELQMLTNIPFHNAAEEAYLAVIPFNRLDRGSHNEPLPQAFAAITGGK